ncbi:(-)-germacrene D synthase-like isoform X1 [Diospyros lotus]|uniref:(-)-germacrene D synthase-like isoform X1 n=1 Tax=Diospyros lotus TaxID=55363 RepID=UPI00225930C5|nr:(-)-germacrene D synthase-like isoform X1 [Diospyros lotus]
MELSVPLSAVPVAQNRVAPEITRRSANFHPTVWGDHFLAYASSQVLDAKAQQQHEKLRDELRKTLSNSASADLIDAIQRLGVAYHFESEIEAAVQRMHRTWHHQRLGDAGDSVYCTALTFRLLRQHGFPVSSDVFKELRGRDGQFKECLTRDVEALLSLYEAAHLGVRGEDVLDELVVFTTAKLKAAVPDLGDALAGKVIHALNQPIRTGLTRLEARSYISLFEPKGHEDKLLLDFAKSDFNLLQKLHQRELSEITRWWKDLDVPKKLPFARDRVVESYFWITGVYFEPQYELGRKVLTKVFAMTCIIDDAYDAYGTLEELALFTYAIEKWHVSATHQLPEYMRLCYEALLDVYNMIEEEMAKQGRSYAVDYAKSTMKKLVRAYFEEAKWFHQGYTPSMEEYKQVALVTSTYEMISTNSLVGMGDLATQEAFDWVSSHPLIVRASSIIFRLMDDIAGHKFEQERGHVASAVECYMEQYGASEEEAVVELKKQVGEAWKDINAEMLQPTKVAMPLLVRVLNLARVTNVMYSHGDGYTDSVTNLKDIITSLFIQAVPT